ncbi:MAG: hypothetical protein ACO3JL_18565 [Myxococcota bacterium]
MERAIFSEALEAIEARSRVLRDYRYEGVAFRPDPPHEVHFRYALKQPKMLRADVDELATSFVFDGRTLSILDHGHKQAVRQDLTALDDGAAAGALHQFFHDYSSEGWKPPLLRPDLEANRAVRERQADGTFHWLVETQLDDAALAFVRYELRAPTADFVKKEFVDKAGTVVASIEVKNEHHDAQSGLHFPSVWELASGQNRFRVELRDIHINEGLGPAHFEAAVPAGYSLKEIQR